MRRILTLILIIAGFSSFAQTVPIGGPTTTNPVPGLLDIRNVMNLKLLDTTATKSQFPATIQYRLARESGRLYYNATGSKFVLLDSVTGGGSNPDTTQLATRAYVNAGDAIRVRYADTTVMLSPYLRSALGLKYTDTAAMLSAYSRSATAMKYSDTVSLSNRINAKLNTADTATMLTPYAKSVQVVKYADTAGMLAGYAKRSHVDSIATIVGSNETSIGFKAILVPQAGNISRTDNNYIATVAMSNAMGNQSLPANHNGTVSAKHNSDERNAVLGFDTSKVPLTAATQFITGFSFFNNVLYVWENGGPTSKGTALNQYYRLSRAGSTFTLSGSDDRTIWTLIHTFQYTSNAQMYLHALLVNDGSGNPTLTDVRTNLASNTLAIGNSTVAAYLGQNAVADYLYNGYDTSKGYAITSLAVPGNTIAQQKAAYQAYATPKSIDAIICEIGLNDLDPGVPLSTTLAAYQDLINTMRSGSKPGTQIICATMTPCKQRLIDVYGSTAGLVSYQKWLDMNQAFMGLGGTPITGVDYRFSGHTAALNDGNGYLLPEFDMGDHIHENNAARQIIASYWKGALQGNKQYYDTLSGSVKQILMPSNVIISGNLSVSGTIANTLKYSDTAALSNRIDLRVKYTDTATALAPYAYKTKVVSDSNTLASATALRVKYTDTAAMLVNGNTALAIGNDLSYPLPSINLNIIPIRVGLYWSTSNGTNQTLASWSSTQKIPVLPNTWYTISGTGTRNDVWGYLANGLGGAGIVKNTVTGGFRFLTGDSIYFVTVNLTNTSQTGFDNTFQINLGQTVLPFVSPLVSSGNALDSAAAPAYWTKTKADSAIKANTPSIGSVSVMANSTTVWMRAKYSDSLDVVQRFDVNSNNLDNLTSTRLIGKTDSITATGLLINNPVDNLAPVQFTNLGNTWGNHGNEVIKLYAVGHGKTSADIGSRWSDGTYKYFLSEVNTVDSLTVYGCPYTLNGELVYRRSSLANATLTSDSGAVHAANIVTIFTVADQRYPSSKGVTRQLLVDNVLRPRNGTLYRGNLIELVDSGGIVDATTMIPSPVFTTQNSASLATVVLRQRFAANGMLTMDQTIIPLINHRIRNAATIQVQQPTNVGTYTNYWGYFPGVNPITVGANTYQLGTGVLLNTIPADILITKTDVKDSTIGTNKSILAMKNASGQIGTLLVFGYNMTYGNSTNASRKYNNTTYYNRIATTGKIYPYLYSDKFWGDTAIYSSAYYGFIDPRRNDSLIASYTVPTGDGRYIHTIYTRNTLKNYRVKVDGYLANLPITILERQGNITLNTPDAVPGDNLVVSCTDTVGYLTLLIGAPQVGSTPFTVTADAALTPQINTNYIFSGTTSTWTLPPAAIYGGKQIVCFKNRGSGNITVGTSGSANELFVTSATNTYSITPGSTATFFSDGTFWNLQ